MSFEYIKLTAKFFTFTKNFSRCVHYPNSLMSPFCRTRMRCYSREVKIKLFCSRFGKRGNDRIISHVFTLLPITRMSVYVCMYHRWNWLNKYWHNRTEQNQKKKKRIEFDKFFNFVSATQCRLIRQPKLMCSDSFIALMLRKLKRGIEKKKITTKNFPSSTQF